MTIEQRARKKLAGIIAREGDAGGERRKPYYLAILVDEIRQQDAFAEFCATHRIPKEVQA